MINRDNFLKQKFSTGFVKKVEGEGVSFDNSIGAPFNSFNGDGESTQKITNGNQLIDFANPSSKTTGVSSTFENDTLTIVGTAGSSYQSASWLVSKTFLEKNKGKTIKYKHKSAKISNQKASSNVQISVGYTDDTPTFYRLIYNFNTQGTDTYVIPSDISNISYIRVGIYTNNSANADVENTITIEEPLLYFDNNDTYEPFTNREPSPSPDYPQQINSIGDNLECVKTKLPSEYQEVEYIESTNTQYIDTGVVAKENIGFKLKCLFNEWDGLDRFVLGSRENLAEGINNGLYFGIGFGGRNYGLGIGDFVNKISETIIPPRYNEVLKINYNNLESKITVNNDTVDITKGNFLGDGPNITLFARNTQSGTGNRFKGRIYSCKIYDNNNLVRDFVPCYRKSDNVIGMYDLANNIFYTNSGTGDFLKGADISDINLNIDLGEEKLRSIDDVKDELVIDMSTGDYYKVENIREVILNGTENWIANLNSVFTLVQDIGLKVFNLDDKPKITSNFFTTISNRTIYNEYAAITAYIPTSTYNFSKIVIAYKEMSNLSEFQQWLSTHNTIVDYQLATPITKKIGTLSKEDLNKLSSFDGHNNILVNTNLGLMNIRLEYRSKIN